MEFTPSEGMLVFERYYKLLGAPVFEKGDKPFFPQKVMVRWYEHTFSDGKDYGGHSVKLRGPLRLASGKLGTREGDFTFGHESIAHVFHHLPEWLRPVYTAAREAYNQQRSSLDVAIGCAAGLRIQRFGSPSYGGIMFGARKIVETILLSMYGPHDAAAKAEQLIDDAVEKIQAAQEQEE